MPRPTTVVRTRTPSRPNAAAAPPPARQLRPRRATWPAAVLVLLGVTTAAAGVLSLTDRPQLVAGTILLGVLAAAGWAALGIRNQRRQLLLDQVIETVAPLIGGPAVDRRLVRARRWRGWPGAPRQLTLHYAPAVVDSDPTWKTRVVTAVSGRMPIEYEIASVHPRRCRLVLRPARPTDREGMSAVQARAEQAVSDLLGPTAVLTDAQVGDDGALTAMTVRHQIGHKVAAAGYRVRVERVVAAMFGGRWRAHWDLTGDTVVFETRPSFPDQVWLPPLDVDPAADLLASYDQVRIPFGVSEDGDDMIWRPAIDPNLMLVGAPGSGKTKTAHTLLIQATRHGWPVWIVDGKSVEFLAHQDWPNVQVVATSIQEQVAVVHRAWELMEHRYRLITSGRASAKDFTPLLLFIDEWADFRGNLTNWYAEVKVKGEPTKPPAFTKVSSLARKGRTSRVHLVFGTQRPDAEYFGGDMRDNFRARISMGRLSPQGAMMMWENPTVGVSLPRGKRGRATAIDDENRPVEVQTYLTPNPGEVVEGSEEAALLERLRPDTVQNERLLILPPRQAVDPDTGETSPVGYYDWAETSWALAAAHPELDPVRQREQVCGSGRDLASPLTMLGVTGHGTPPPARPRPGDGDTTTAHPSGRGVDVAATAAAGSLLPDDGYGPESTTMPMRLDVGDLLHTGDGWVVVDLEPEPDETAPGCVSVFWRDDADDQGVLSVPDDELVTVRRPHELVEEA